MKSKNTFVHWAVVSSAGAVLMLNALAARANSVYANFLSTDGLGNFTYQIQFSSTAPPGDASIFANGGGLEIDSFPGFIGAAKGIVQFGSSSDWTMTTGVDSAKFIYTGGLTTTVSGTNLLTVILSSTIVTLNPNKTIPTMGYDYTDQGGMPGLAQTNSGHVQGPGVGAVVPLPAALWAGLSLLGGMGAFGAMRRKAHA